MAIAIVYYDNGVPVREWDDDLRVYTERDRDTGATTLQRPYTDEENTQADERAEETTESVNQADLLTKAKNALAKNIAYLAIQAPTNAQAVAQVEKLTRQMDAVIRLLTKSLDSTEGS